MLHMEEFSNSRIVKIVGEEGLRNWQAIEGTITVGSDLNKAQIGWIKFDTKKDRQETSASNRNENQKYIRAEKEEEESENIIQVWPFFFLNLRHMRGLCYENTE